MTRDHVPEWPLWLALALGLVLAFGCTPGASEPVSPRSLAVAWPELDEYSGDIEPALELFPCSMFHRAWPREPVDVTIHQEDGLTPPCGIGEPWLRAGRRAQAEGVRCPSGRVEIWGEWTRMGSTERYLVVAHELGHVAGLDDAPPAPASGVGERALPLVVSIMAQGVHRHADRLDRRQLLPVLLRRDEAELRGRWCGGAL